MMVHDFKTYPELTNSQMDIYYFQSPHKQITESFEALVVKVHDGDTITVEVDFRDFTFPVRFAEIAAPELKEQGGKESQSWLEKKLLNKKVYIEIDPKDRVGKWGRILGNIIFRGMDIGEESIVNGFAVSFTDRNSGRIPDFGKALDEVKL